VETAEALPLLSVADAESATRQRPLTAVESCQIVVDEPQRVEIAVALAEPGWVVLSDLYYPGWTAAVVTEGQRGVRTVPVVRTDRILRGVCLPPGRHRLMYTYRPVRFYAGAAASAAAWLILAIVGGIRCATLRSPPLLRRGP
jgi:uncharacterized membrane protein YfhO